MVRGKDSTSIALKLKVNLPNPLLVTFSPLIENLPGVHNRNELSKLGFDPIFINPNKSVSRNLKRFFIERELKVAGCRNKFSTCKNCFKL